MKYLDSVRARVLAVALVPVGALAVVGLTLGGFLVHQGLQEKEFADKAVAATNSATYLVTNVQQERRRIDIGRPHADTARDKVVHDALANLQRAAVEAPNAQVGYEQLIAAQLLAAVDGLSRTDALAAAGAVFTAEGLRSFVEAFGSYHANLAAAAPNLSARCRELYTTLVGSEGWSRLTAVENALVAGDRSPVAEADWRASAREVADDLVALSTQQSTYATQLAEGSGRRTFVGALAGVAAILIVAAAAFVVAVRLSRRLGTEPVAAKPLPRRRGAHARPRSSVPRLQIPDPHLMEAVLANIRKL